MIEISQGIRQKEHNVINLYSKSILTLQKQIIVFLYNKNDGQEGTLPMLLL